MEAAVKEYGSPGEQYGGAGSLLKNQSVHLPKASKVRLLPFDAQPTAGSSVSQ